MSKKGSLDEIVEGTITKENPKGITYRTLVEENNLLMQQIMSELAKQRNHEHSEKNGKPLIPME